MKSIVKIIILFSLLLTAALCLSSCGGKVPVYQGMSITSGEKSLHVPGYAMPLSAGISVESENEENIGVPPLDEDEALESVGGEVQESYLEVLGSAKEIYYATPNEDIYINIHIDNPDNFEILSFTLNGSVYSSYMFEDGSDMQTLILKYNVGMESGIQEYTIDAIKYVDGTEIKDVRMDGDKTVRAAIKTENQVSAMLNSVSKGKGSLNLSVTLSDNDGLIEFSNGVIKILLYDETGTTLIGTKDLKRGENEISFENLSSNTSYQYIIGGFYDDLSGKGVGIHLLDNGVVSTDYVILFDNVVANETGVVFDVLFNELLSDKTLFSLKLYTSSGEIERELNIQDRSISALLSDTSYTLVAEYNTAEAHESISIEFKTVAIAEPSFEFSEPTLTDSSIEASFSILDVGNILSDYKVELYSENSLVAYNEEKKISFSGLEGYTEYTVRITYTFDRNDGLGAVTKTAEKNIKTPPSVEFISMSVLNDGYVSYGEILYLRIALNNPSGLTPVSVQINGHSYDVSPSSTNSSILLEIPCDDRFTGKETQITAERIRAEKNGEYFNIAPGTPLADSVYVNGKIEVLDICVVNSDTEKINWAFPSQKIYALLTLNNPTGYILNEISLADTVYTEISKIDNEKWLVAISIEEGNNNLPLTNIKYSNEYISKKLEVTDKSCRCFEVLSDKTVSISAPLDLLSLNKGYYYELTADLDLSGLEWMGEDFYGVLDAKGHSISNMSIEISTRAENVFAGLFRSVTGVVQNLNIKASRINVFLNSTSARFILCAGLVASHIDNGAIINCTTDSDSSVYGENIGIGSAYIGGLVGLSQTQSVIDGAVNRAQITSASSAGGIVGAGAYDSAIYNCENYAQVSANTGVGGITSNAFFIYNCKNYGKICGTGVSIGGISGTAEYIYSCENAGEICALSTASAKWIGGIVGNGSYIYDCKNSGKINIDASSEAASIGGVVGEGADIYRCINEGEIKDTDKKISEVGGIVGNATSFVFNCVNSADISGKRNVGGIVGRSEFAIEGCENSGNISGVSNIGGIAGIISNTSLSSCKNSGSVSGESYIGGITGNTSTFSSVSKSENYGKICGTAMQIGGITGEVSLSDVFECKNFGEICGNMQVGGIAGFNNGTVKDSENSGKVFGESDIGGVVGYNFDKVISSYNYGSVEGKFTAGGIAGYISDISSITDCENFGDVTPKPKENN